MAFTTTDENLSLKCYILKTTRNNLIIPVGRRFVPLAQDIRPSYSQCCCSSAANLSERGRIFFKGKTYLGEGEKSEKGDGKHGSVRFATFSHQFKRKEAKTWLKQCQKHKGEIWSRREPSKPTAGTRSPGTETHIHHDLQTRHSPGEPSHHFNGLGFHLIPFYTPLRPCAALTHPDTAEFDRAPQ